LTKEKLGDISVQTEQSQRKSLKIASQQVGASYSSARNAMTLLNLLPYKLTEVQVLILQTQAGE
jgi:molybdenum-dependent DNA-binding transcriptional regulator ModE